MFTECGTKFCWISSAHLFIGLPILFWPSWGTEVVSILFHFCGVSLITWPAYFYLSCLIENQTLLTLVFLAIFCNLIWSFSLIWSMLLIVEFCVTVILFSCFVVFICQDWENCGFPNSNFIFILLLKIFLCAQKDFQVLTFLIFNSFSVLFLVERIWPKYIFIYYFNFIVVYFDFSQIYYVCSLGIMVCVKKCSCYPLIVTQTSGSKPCGIFSW